MSNAEAILDAQTEHADLVAQGLEIDADLIDVNGELSRMRRRAHEYGFAAIAAMERKREALVVRKAEVVSKIRYAKQDIRDYSEAARGKGSGKERRDSHQAHFMRIAFELLPKETFDRISTSAYEAVARELEAKP